MRVSLLFIGKYLVMNYKKHYNALCKRGQTDRSLDYSEKHHIIPKCKGGSNDAENITHLTAKEHYLAHYLLHMMYPEDRQLWYALFSMAFMINENQQRYQVSSRVYERLKLEKSEDSKKNIATSLKNLEKAVQAVKGKKRDKTWNEKATKAWIEKKGKGSAMKREDLLYLIKKHKGYISKVGKELGWPGPTVASGCRYHNIDYRQIKQEYYER